ncbi:Outer dynein arm protein 1 [Hondaea fermentalgiana]|uniref:Outer dynein arm protein 1 n=1 Tax=Hondaea fermentalgiana TaxID=2315210 RepID=A0A2R5G9P8_9STRA|nr:Outer dynein arm protein 1 [Hondaea fermentalgiana]|eukprot:GBG27285.1 Outer dynein arm protein 1 [Hondaea fermentalgiana]
MIQQRIIEEKKRMRNVGGVRATLDQKLKAAKRTKILNTKLERLHLRRNDINVENNALKASINERRKERMAFESIQCKLRADFEQKQKEMANLLRSSNELITNRIRAEKDLKRVEREESIAKEKANSELDRLEGIVRKQEVIQTEMQTASLKRRAHQIREQLGRGRLDPEEEAKLKARLQSLTVKIEKKSHEIDATHQLTLLNYEEAFEKILAEVPARSDKPMTLSEVVENYVDDYDDAFSLLSYIQGIQDENFQLETEIANLRDEMGRLTSQQGKEDQNKERIRRELQRRLETLRQQNLRLNDSIQDREKSRELTFVTVERIMTRFNTTLGGHIGLIDGTVCDDHVMHVLGQVELKALQLTQLLQQSIRLGTFRGMPARGQITTPSPALVRQATFRAGKIRIGPTSPHRSTRALIPSVQPLSSVKIQELFTAHIRLLEDPADDEADTLARTETRASGFHEQDFGGPASPLESRPRLSIQSVDDLRRIIQQNFPLVDTAKPKASTP